MRDTLNPESLRKATEAVAARCECYDGDARAQARCVPYGPDVCSCKADAEAAIRAYLAAEAERKPHRIVAAMQEAVAIAPALASEYARGYADGLRDAAAKEAPHD